MKLVTLAVDAVVEVLVDEDDPKRAARAAAEEYRRSPDGRPMTVLRVEPLTIAKVEGL